MPFVKTHIHESIPAWAHASHALEIAREMSLVEVTEFLRQRGEVHIGADTESRQRILKAEASNQPFRRNAERTLASILDGTAESLSAWASRDTETISRSFSADSTISRAFNKTASCLGVCASR